MEISEGGPEESKKRLFKKDQITVAIVSYHKEKYPKGKGRTRDIRTYILNQIATAAVELGEEFKEYEGVSTKIKISEEEASAILDQIAINSDKNDKRGSHLRRMGIDEPFLEEVRKKLFSEEDNNLDY